MTGDGGDLRQSLRGESRQRKSQAHIGQVPFRVPGQPLQPIGLERRARSDDMCARQEILIGLSRQRTAASQAAFVPPENPPALASRAKSG